MKNLVVRLCLLVLIILLVVRVESEYYWLILDDMFMDLSLNKETIKTIIIILGVLLLINVLVFVFVRRKKLYDFS